MLYVDDEPLMCRAVVRALKRHPLDVLTATSGEEAIAFATRELFDLVVTDYLLDDLKGTQIAARIHAIQPEAEIVLVSGFFEWAEREKELQAAGIQYFMQKPWEIGQLEGIISDILKRKPRP